MPVSPGLQKHFDTRWPGKKQIQSSLDDLQGKIDPAFLASFEKFRVKVLDIVEDTPESEAIVGSQIRSLGTKLEQLHHKKQVKMFESITDNV